CISVTISFSFPSPFPWLSFSPAFFSPSVIYGSSVSLARWQWAPWQSGSFNGSVSSPPQSQLEVGGCGRALSWMEGLGGWVGGNVCCAWSVGVGLGLTVSVPFVLRDFRKLD